MSDGPKTNARDNQINATQTEGTEDGLTVAAASRLVEVNVHALELEVRVTVEGAGGVDAVLIGDDFPELGADLVTALACLKVDNLAHSIYYRIRKGGWGGGEKGGGGGKNRTIGSTEGDIAPPPRPRDINACNIRMNLDAYWRAPSLNNGVARAKGVQNGTVTRSSRTRALDS
jgi:hypothetical protein